MSNIRPYLSPPPPKKALTSTPWPGQLFYNLTSGHYENNNRLSVFSMTDCTEKISKIIFFLLCVHIGPYPRTYIHDPRTMNLKI